MMDLQLPFLAYTILPIYQLFDPIFHGRKDDAPEVIINQCKSHSTNNLLLGNQTRQGARVGNAQ